MSLEDIGHITALVRDYYDGMVYGQADTLERVFDPDARFQGFRDGQPVRRGLTEFIAMTSPASDPVGGLPEYAVTIDLLDVTGRVAVVKVRDQFRGRLYVDYLTLICTPSGWRIANKAFTSVDP